MLISAPTFLPSNYQQFLQLVYHEVLFLECSSDMSITVRSIGMFVHIWYNGIGNAWRVMRSIFEPFL